MSDNPFTPRMTAQNKADADEATKTLYMLADQVGVKCASCGTTLHGHDAICAVSYMAPFGTQDFEARPYCEPCSERFRSE